MALGQHRSKEVVHLSGKGARHTSLAFGKRPGDGGDNQRMALAVYRTVLDVLRNGAPGAALGHCTRDCQGAGNSGRTVITKTRRPHSFRLWVAQVFTAPAHPCRVFPLGKDDGLAARTQAKPRPVKPVRATCHPMDASMRDAHGGNNVNSASMPGPTETTLQDPQIPPRMA